MLRDKLPLMLVVVALAACGSAREQASVDRAADPRSDPRVAAAEADALRDGNAAFGGRLLDLLADGDSNVALSPYSISQALAMTSVGARGETATEIADALDFRLPQARLHPAFNALDRALAGARCDGVTLSVANALYGQQDTSFRAPFLEVLARHYGAGMRAVDFARDPQGATEAINAWVSDRTNAKIPRLLTPGDIGALTRLVLVNAVYLDAKWERPFEREATTRAPFHAPGGTVDVPTMNQLDTFGYVRGPGYRALELPYRGGRLAFDVLLADSGRLPALLRRLRGGGVARDLRGLRPALARVALPKLELRTRLELTDALEKLGMRRAFGDDADLSGIARKPGEIRITAVVHETFIRVDEAGTEAAAATGAAAGITSAPSEPAVVFNVDRPFAFVLRDRRTGAILFTGTVSKP